MYFGNMVKIWGGKIWSVEKIMLMFGNYVIIFGLVSKHFDFCDEIGQGVAT